MNVHLYNYSNYYLHKNQNYTRNFYSEIILQCSLHFCYLYNKKESVFVFYTLYLESEK